MQQQDIIQNWSQDVNLRSEMRLKVIKEMIDPNAEGIEMIPDDLGLYDVRDLQITDIDNHFNGFITFYAISKNKVKFYYGVITPEILINDKPLFIAAKVLTREDADEDTERGVVLERLLLRCNNYFEDEYSKARALALETAKAQLS